MCENGGLSPAKTRAELLGHLRDFLAALKKWLAAITAKCTYVPSEEPCVGRRVDFHRIAQRNILD